MAFKGTKRRSALQIAEEIEDVGGYINAYTSREMTAYYARVLEADVPLAMDVIADIVLNPLFDKKEIEVERHVILQEIGQALDTPDDIIFDWLQEAAYPDQAMGRTILGPAERVSSFQRKDLQTFVASHYGPDRIILSGAGAVNHAQLVEIALRLFGHLKPALLPTPEPARWQGAERREVKDLEQVHFAMGFRAPAYRDADMHTAQVYATAVGGGMSGGAGPGRGSAGTTTLALRRATAPASGPGSTRSATTSPSARARSCAPTSRPAPSSSSRASTRAASRS